MFLMSPVAGSHTHVHDWLDWELHGYDNTFASLLIGVTPGLVHVITDTVQNLVQQGFYLLYLYATRLAFHLIHNPSPDYCNPL